MHATQGFRNELDFTDSESFARSEAAPLDSPLFDDLQLGLVGANRDGTVFAYGRFEAGAAGRSAGRCFGLVSLRPTRSRMRLLEKKTSRHQYLVVRPR